MKPIGVAFVALLTAMAPTLPAGATETADSTDASPAPPGVRAFIVASYNAALARGGDTIVNRLFGMPNQQFTLDIASVALERPVRARHREAGFAVRAVAGTSVAPAKAAGLDPGTDADVVEAVVQVNLPAGAGDLKLTAGKMPSLLGVESLDPTANPNATGGSQFLYLEDYTDTGVDASWQGAGMLSGSLRLTNGWDVVRDPNLARTVFARVGLAPDARTAFNLFGYTGAERPDNGHDRRSGLELLARRNHAHGSVQLQLDVGQEEGIDAQWWGGGVWATWALTPRAEFALRLDRMEDLDGARAAGVLGFPPGAGQRLDSVTGTFNLRPLAGLLVRPEARYDLSTATAFDGHTDQWTLGLSAGCVY